MVERALCTGCSACAAVCALGAIRMEEEDGFLFPHIDEVSCIQCGKCQHVCPVEKQGTKQTTETKLFMVYAHDDELRKDSSSGGVFTLLAQKVIATGGFVYGSAMMENFYGAHHICVSEAEELWRLRGSKYVQSALEDSFLDVKKKLESGRQVLFSGTPCQVAGLRAFLGNKTYENLLTLDVICHGVPSPMVWRKYAQELEAQYGAKLKAVSYRDKFSGWAQYSLFCQFENGAQYRKPVTEDLYLRGFIEDIYLRYSCYNCKFKGDGYESDITIGDFWGVERIFPSENTDQGISLAIAHTKQGSSAIEALEGCVRKEVESDLALRSNSNYYASVKRPPLRDKAMNSITKYGTGKSLRKFCGSGIQARIRRKAAKLLCMVKHRS